MAKPVIWITGASSGIGEAAAQKFSTEGYALILSSRNLQELERVKNSCAFPEDIRILPLDLADSGDFNQKVPTALSFFGKVDMLLHNGGISQRSLIKDTN
jgi:NADP-dependent 3-hydroxy acid dehydrogenase YdfG